MSVSCKVCFNHFEFSPFLIFFPFLAWNKTKDRYMAPEVFRHRRYDKKVDVFSFAMILYEVMLFLYKELRYRKIWDEF